MLSSNYSPRMHSASGDSASVRLRYVMGHRRYSHHRVTGTMMMMRSGTTVAKTSRSERTIPATRPPGTKVTHRNRTKPSEPSKIKGYRLWPETVPDSSVTGTRVGARNKWASALPTTANRWRRTSAMKVDGTPTSRSIWLLELRRLRLRSASSIRRRCPTVSATARFHLAR